MDTNTSDEKEKFDPNKDIDLSHIEIIDTSKGGKIDFEKIPYSQIYSYKCTNCLFRYEGSEKISICPKCGSTSMVDQ